MDFESVKLIDFISVFGDWIVDFCLYLVNGWLDVMINFYEIYYGISVDVVFYV